MTKRLLICQDYDQVSLLRPERLHTRRNFMNFGVQAAGAGTFLLLTGWPAREAHANPLLFLFRAAATAFVGAVVSHYVAKWLGNTPVKYEPPVGNDVHSRNSSDYAFDGAPVPMTRTQTGDWLEVNERVRSDSQSPVRSYKDLNEAEMNRCVAEKDLYDGVLHPCDYRADPDSRSRAQFERVCRANYSTDPALLRLEYTRPFTSAKVGQRPYLAFGVTSRRDPSKKDLLISV